MVREKIVGFLKQGLTPRDLALTIALGSVIGVFPVLGMTTILCTLAAVTLRLNLPALQSINWAVAPLQLLLLIQIMFQELFWIFNLGFDISRISNRNYYFMSCFKIFQLIDGLLSC